MAYRANPFLERRSEETNTPDQEFVRFFSPKVLERLPDKVFHGGVHIFRSPPGGGKTTILRAFSPTALRAFWHAKKAPEMSETFQRLASQQVIDENQGPKLLGVMLSCASGYADLPPGALFGNDGIFRALVNCRIVLRTLRSVAALIDATDAQFEGISLEYDAGAQDLKGIPRLSSASELLNWAEDRERTVYAELDSFEGAESGDWPSDVRFEGLLWLQSVQFRYGGSLVGERRLLMIDDMHKLKRHQRAKLIEEMVELRPGIPVWMAERNIALGSALLAQGARDGRDIHEVPLDELWGKGQHSVFQGFAQNILERRLAQQIAIPQANFGQYLMTSTLSEDVREKLDSGFSMAKEAIARFRENALYREWIESVDHLSETKTVESLQQIFLVMILIARNERKRQASLLPLSAEELEEKDGSKDEAAADIFMREFAGLPYYFGIDRVCTMATYNVEELLSLAATLYDGIKARLVLRKDVALTTLEQERLLSEAAKRKLSFIPKTHTVGSHAQRLLEGIGRYCRGRTFEMNAPYAPGVTGIRLSEARMRELEEKAGISKSNHSILYKVLSECVAENLLVRRASAASTSREAGTVFYLNRTLCAAYGLPLGTGGWQDTTLDELIRWMLQGATNVRQPRLELA